MSILRRFLVGHQLFTGRGCAEGTIPASKFHKTSMLGQACGDSIGVSTERLDFSIGQVILVQICDLFKQLQALFYNIRLVFVSHN